MGQTMIEKIISRNVGVDSPLVQIENTIASNSILYPM